jgi:hypothetical protein
MELLQTISKMALAVWRLTRTVQAAFNNADSPSGLFRLVDYLCWIGVWMSAQTALWVACGFAGVLLNWVAFSGAALRVRRLKEPPQAPREEPSADQTAITAIGTYCHGAAQLCR